MSTKVTRQKTKQGMKEDMLFHAHVYSILYLYPPPSSICHFLLAENTFGYPGRAGLVISN